MAETSFDDLLLAVRAIQEIQKAQVHIALEVSEMRRALRNLQHEVASKAGNNDGFVADGLSAVNTRCDDLDSRIGNLEASASQALFHADIDTGVATLERQVQSEAQQVILPGNNPRSVLQVSGTPTKVKRRHGQSPDTVPSDGDARDT